MTGKLQGNVAWQKGPPFLCTWGAPLTGGSHDLLQGTVTESFLHLLLLKFLPLKVAPGCLGKSVPARRPSGMAPGTGEKRRGGVRVPAVGRSGRTENAVREGRGAF